MFHTGRICPVWCNFSPSYPCRTSIIFGTVKNGSLKIDSLPLNNCFCYRNVLQYGVNSSSKWFLNNLVFCPKAQNFVHFGLYDLVQISSVCGPNTYQVMYGYSSEFQCQQLQHQQRRVLMANLLQKLIRHFMLPLLTLPLEAWSPSIHYLISIWTIWWWNLNKIVWYEIIKILRFFAKCWRFFGRRSWNINICLMLKYQSKDYHL